MTDAPSQHAVMRAVSTLQQLAEQLRALCPDIEDDDALFSDTLQGEAPDALAVIERLIDASLAAADMAELAHVRLTDLAERKARFEKRRDAYRQVALQMMEAVNLKKLERPHFTASLRQMPAPLIIDRDVLSMDEWWRHPPPEPNKTDIRKALLDGVDIPGAQLGNPATGLTVRTK
jgi:hypothetical protein